MRYREREGESVCACVHACVRGCVCVCVREYSDIATNEYLYFGPIYTHIYIYITLLSIKMCIRSCMYE